MNKDNAMGTRELKLEFVGVSSCSNTESRKEYCIL